MAEVTERRPKSHSQFRWKAYLIFCLIVYPCCFALTWFRQSNCVGYPNFSVRPCTYWSNHEIAIFSLGVTIIAAFFIVPKLR